MRQTLPWRMPRTGTGPGGFSLVEILIGVGLSSMLAVVIYIASGRLTRASMDTAKKTEQTQSLELASSNLAKELRQMEKPKTGMPVEVKEHSVAFPKRDKTIEIKWVEPLRQIVHIAAGTESTTRTLAHQIDNLHLTYLDDLGNEITDLPDSPVEALAGSKIEKLRSIKIALRHENEEFHQIVKLRNYASD